jgi:LacI family transcriptional regulator
MGKGSTMKEIAGLAGVSIRTVSLALQGEGRMSGETRERVRRIARELNYRPDLAAKGLRMRRSFLIGAVFPYLNVSFFNRAIGGIEEACFAAGFDIMLSSPPGAEGSASSLDRLIARKVDGIIAAPSPWAYGEYRGVEEAGIPLLQVFARAPGLAAPFVGVDNEAGGRMATAYLVGLGHRSIGFLASSIEPYAEMDQRYKGYLEALVEAGIRIDAERLRAKAGDLLDLDAAQGAAAELLARVPEMTAIFAPTDYAAIGAVRACGAAGLRVPEDISVIGYDDIEIAGCQIEHPLSTVAQPKEELGREAFAALLELMATGRTEDRLMKPTLVPRATTGPASCPSLARSATIAP